MCIFFVLCKSLFTRGEKETLSFCEGGIFFCTQKHRSSKCDREMSKKQDVPKKIIPNDMDNADL